MIHIFVNVAGRMNILHQSQLFDDQILGIIRESMLKWRNRMMDKLKEVVQKYPPVRDVDLESLADMLMVVFEGSFVLSQSLNNTKVIANQLSHFHSYLSLLFQPES